MNSGNLVDAETFRLARVPRYACRTIFLIKCSL